MASMMKRLRLHYMGRVRISRLLTPLVVLLVLYGVYRYTRKPTLGVVRAKAETYPHRMSGAEIDEYLAALQDTRPELCTPTGHVLRNAQENRVSIVVSFHGDEAYGLKLTLSSILAYTAPDLYSEIVVLDDGTDNVQIRNHMATFLQDSRFGDKIKAYRSPQTRGPGASRLKGTLVAKGDILVFVRSSTVVNNGWLEPLVVALNQNEKRIVVPHSDNFLSEKRFFQLSDDLVPTFTWPLSVVYAESREPPGGQLLRAPVMRGDVVAVTSRFLKSIGSYDDGLLSAGAENVELSLRTWLCGGEVLVALCSRVVTHSALKPVDVTRAEDVRRIARLWLGDYADVTYRQTDNNGVMTAKEEQSFVPRRSWLKTNVKCESFDWFLNTVSRDTIPPSAYMVHFGKLKAQSMYCAHRSADGSGQVTLVLCRPYMYDPTMMFELDTKGRIRQGDNCLMASGADSAVLLTECSEYNQSQKWTLQDGRLTISSLPGQCMTHVTEARDMETRHHGHYMQMAECSGDKKDDRTQNWDFIRY